MAWCYLPIKEGNRRILLSGAEYTVTPKGPWVRTNHPQNKHDRRAAVARKGA